MGIEIFPKFLHKYVSYGFEKKFEICIMKSALRALALCQRETLKTTTQIGLDDWTKEKSLKRVTHVHIVF